jgi:hypothetical protein
MTDLPEYPLFTNPPAGWVPEFSYAVELTYKYEGGVPLFAYRDLTSYSNSRNIINKELSETPFGDYYTLDQFNKELDLTVNQNCQVVIKMDDDKDMSWSLERDAVTTKNILDSRYYFMLKYVRNRYGYPRPKFPAEEKCRQVSFGCLLNKDYPNLDQHPFNLNLIIVNPDGQDVKIHIDPDIRNPGGIVISAPVFG